MSAPRFEVRAAERGDAPALAALLDAYMQETFRTVWHGSAEALARDGFGREFETLLAVATGGQPIGFAAWAASYDLHHCVRGGDVLDLYVVPPARARGVAAALVCAVARSIREAGGAYVKGHAVEVPAVERLYMRAAMRFPGADVIVGGRAFRRLADLAGLPARTLARSLPDPSWNHEA